MKLIVNPHKIKIVKEPVNEREVNITRCEFEFADEITNDFVKKAYFTLNDNTYEVLIENNECYIPNEVLVEKGQVELGVVCEHIDSNDIITRYNPAPAYFETWQGSLREAGNVDPLTPTDKERIEQDILDLKNSKQDKLIAGENITIDSNNVISATGGGSGATYTAGTNIEISDDNVISAPLNDYYNQSDVDGLLDLKQDKLIAGDNITIDENNVISATGGGGGDPTNYVTISTNQTITGEKTYTSQVKIQNGSASGALIIGADSGQTTMTAGNRKLGRMSFPLQEFAGTRNCAFASCDTLNTEGQSPINCVEFGGRVGDVTTTSPDELNFTVASVHNTLNNNQKKRALQIKSNQAKFVVPVYYNNNQLENMGNKVTSISSSSTNTQYPSAKAVYDNLAVKSNISETGKKIDLEIDNTTYKMVAKLYDKNNNLISTSSEIDLPIESLVIDADYDSTTRSIILTLTNGVTTSVPVGDLITGLVSDDDLTQALAGKQDTLTAGSNISIQSGVISATDTTYSVATQNDDGLMSSTDKVKLDSIDSGAEINDISTIQVNGVTQIPESKVVNLLINEDKNYVHEQSIPADTWNINHNLGKYPSVIIMDSSNNEVIGEVQYTDLNNIIVSFNGVFSGKATLN